MKKQARPDIPKLKIISIGSFDTEGKPKGWRFDGSSNPQSVGLYISEDWYLHGGYTVEELKVIAGIQREAT